MAASPSPTSPNPVGLWFCQISSGLQGKWQGGRADPQQGANISGAGAGAGTEAGQARATDAAGGKDDEPTRRAAATTCRRDAMPEATVCLLLDRFAPS